MSGADAIPGSALTSREHELGQLLRQGLTNKEIGARVGYSPPYVRNRLRRMMTKTGALNRVQLAVVLEQRECQASA